MIGMSICRRRGKTPAGTIRSGLAVITVIIVLLTAAGCSELVTEPKKEGVEFEGADTDMSFLAAFNISKNIAAEYKLVRVLVCDEAGKIQIGSGSSNGPDKYRITLPASYSGKSVTYVAEFTKKESNFDGGEYKFYKTDYIKPLIVSLLKSRYYGISGEIPKQGNTDTKQLEIDYVSEFKLGWGPGSPKLADFPDAPHVYLINLDTSEIDYPGFTVTQGIAMAGGSTYNDFKLDEWLDSGLGVASQETDWILLLAPAYAPGDPLTFLFIYTITDTITESDISLFVEKSVADVPSETGSTIDITFTELDFQLLYNNALP